MGENLCRKVNGGESRKESDIEKCFFSKMFYKNRGVMLIVDSRTIDIVDANEAACKFYGYSKEILTSMNLREIEILPDNEERHSILKEFKNASKLKNGQVKLKHRLADGTIRDVEVYISPIEVEEVVFLHCIIYDISESQRNKRLLRESERKYKKLFNNMVDSVFLFSLKENGEPGYIIDANETAYKHLGYTKEELQGMEFKDIKTPRALSQAPEKMAKIQEKGHAKYETELVKKDGGIIYAEFNTHLFKMHGRSVILAVSRDITQHKIIQKAIEESEIRYKTLVELSPDAIYVHYDGKIIFTNNRGAQILGFNDSQEVYGKSIWRFTPSYEIKKVERSIELVKTKKINTPIREQKIIRNDGSIIDVEISTASIKYNGKGAILNIMREVTKRKKMEENLQRTINENKLLLEQTLEYDRLKTEFFSNISHELKTPLNIILGGIQLIKGLEENHIECENYKFFGKYINMMRQNCYRLLRLINNIIDITKIDTNYLSVDLKNHNIVSVVEDITMSVAEYINDTGIKLVFDTDREERIIACDVDKIERIILNLLSNAIKYTANNGSIFVNIFDKYDKVIISIRDTGTGIPKDKLQVIFERFRQGDPLLTRKKEGSGIGLSLVKGLVEAHDGNITVNSELGKGSEFIIELPIKVADDDIYVYEDLSITNDEKVERINVEFSDIYS